MRVSSHHYMFSPREMKLYNQAKIVLWGIYEASVD